MIYNYHKFDLYLQDVKKAYNVKEINGKVKSYAKDLFELLIGQYENVYKE